MIGGILILVWIYLLRVLRKADLAFWRFLAGSTGLFVIMMLIVRPFLTEPLARCVCALASVIGTLTDTFSAYFSYGILYIPFDSQSVTLLVDFECSGIIEIMAFLCLLAFFDVYSRTEKMIVGIIGFAVIMVCNAARIVLVAESVHFWGMDAYYIAHTFVGRIFFYACSIFLYFYVFTKPQVVRMKVGNFAYEHN